MGEKKLIILKWLSNKTLSTLLLLMSRVRRSHRELFCKYIDDDDNNNNNNNNNNSNSSATTTNNNSSNNNNDNKIFVNSWLQIKNNLS